MSTVEIKLFTKLPAPLNGNIPPLFVPTEASAVDLTELVVQTLELAEGYSFDFIVEGNFLEGTLAQHIETHGLTLEKQLSVEFQLALAPPKFK